VLVVDDEPGIALLLRNVLERNGYYPLTATGWTDAVNQLELGRPHLVLLDLAMPHVGGASLLEFMRVRGYETPVIVVSGNITDEAAEQLQGLGVAAMIHKPFEVTGVMAEVDRAIGTTGQRAETGPPPVEGAPGEAGAPRSDEGDAQVQGAADEDASDAVRRARARRRKRRPRRWVKAARKRLLLHMGAIILATSLVVAGLLGVAHYYSASAGDTEALPR
jgi:DNA-binding NtrC family response regulator